MGYQSPFKNTTPPLSCQPLFLAKSANWSSPSLFTDRWQKTFKFHNRLCLLTSNPFPHLLNRQPSFFMIQRLDFILKYSSLLAHILYILMYVLFIKYLYHTYFIFVYYTSLLYYTLIKNIYPTYSFTLTCMTVSLFYIIYYCIFLWFSYLFNLNFNWLNLFKRLLRLYIKVVQGSKMEFLPAGRLRASGEDLLGWGWGVLPWQAYGMLSSLLERV